MNYKKLDYGNVTDYMIHLKSLKLSSATINRHLSSIRSYYKYLINNKIVDNSPFKLINGPKKEKKLPNYLQYNEFEDLINVCDETDLGIRNRMILELLFATGIRV